MNGVAIFAGLGRACIPAALVLVLRVLAVDAEPSAGVCSNITGECHQPDPSGRCVQMQQAINRLERRSDFEGVRRLNEQGKAEGCRLKIYRAGPRAR